MLQKLRLTLLQRDGVDDALALHTLQSRLDHLPVGRVDHHGHTGDIGLCSDTVQEIHHLRLRIQQTVVHIDIYHERSVSHLFAGYTECLVVVSFLNQSEELARTCHITTFAHIHKLHLGCEVKPLQTAEPHGLGFLHWHMGLFSSHQFTIACDERLISTTAAADDIHQPFVYQFTHLGCHCLGRLVVEPHRVGKSRIRIGTNIIRCHAGQLSEEGFHLRSAERTVQSDGEDGISADAGEEGLKRLTAQRAPCQITHSHGEHNRQFNTTPLHHPQGGIDGHLGIQTVEDGLNQQGIHPTLYQRVNFFVVSH